MESVWYKKIENNTNEQNESLHKKDFKFFKVDMFLQLAKKVDGFSDNCNTCNSLKITIEDLSGNLSEYLKGDVLLRKKYEKKLDDIYKHVRKEHKVFPFQYYLYTYSFIGIATGTGLAWLVSWIIAPGYVKQGIFLGFVIGIITGRIIGKIKDHRLKTEGRVLE